MFLKLTEQATARIVEDVQLGLSPRWHLYPPIVMLGPFNTQEERSAQYGQTIGSGGDSHEFRFGRYSRLLEGVTAFLQLKESATFSAQTLIDWQTAPMLKGILELVSPDDYFSIPVEDIYFGLDSQGSSLICMMYPEPGKSEKLRLQIALDFECLFCGLKLCGWKLSNPMNYIVRDYDTPHSIEPKGELIEAVRDYLRIIAVPSFDRVDTRDPDFLRECLVLQDRLRKIADTSAYQATVMCNAIEEIVEFFYQ